jgi:hypothetical protein
MLCSGGRTGCPLLTSGRTRCQRDACCVVGIGLGVHC